MSNSVDPDKTAHLDLCCLQKPIIIAYGNERITLLFDFTCYIENLFNFSIPLSHISM